MWPRSDGQNKDTISTLPSPFPCIVMLLFLCDDVSRGKMCDGQGVVLGCRVSVKVMVRVRARVRVMVRVRARVRVTLPLWRALKSSNGPMFDGSPCTLRDG